MRTFSILAYLSTGKCRRVFVVACRHPRWSTHKSHIISSRTFRLRVSRGYIHSYRYSLGKISINTRPEVITLKVVLFQHTFIIRISSGHEISQPFRSATNGKIGTEKERITAECFILPVYITVLRNNILSNVTGRKRLSGQLIICYPLLYILFCIQHRITFVFFPHTPFQFQGVFGFVCRTALSSNHNNAICRTRTIDSSRSGILQNLNTPYITRIDSVNAVIHRETVYDNQRSTACTK